MGKRKHMVLPRSQLWTIKTKRDMGKVTVSWRSAAITVLRTQHWIGQSR